MIWFQLLLLFATNASAASADSASLEKPALSWKNARVGDAPRFELLALADGWLGLVATKGKVQFRSPTGKWSDVLELPTDDVRSIASAGSGILVGGERHASLDPTVFFVGIDGRIGETWNMPHDVLHSVAAWKGARWATVSGYFWRASPDGLLELLSGGKVVRHAEIPAVKVDVRFEVPWNAVLHLGPAGERIFCVPHECGPDFCHYSYCYRGDGDKVVWQQFGRWWFQPVPCGDYLIEQEYAVPDRHLSFPRNRTIVRRITDGVQVATVRTGADTGISCAGPDEFLLNAGKSITSFSLPSGRRRWSMPVPVRVGNVVQLARAGTCTIALTDRDAMVSICQGVGEKMVTTVTR